jgi:hypothetical protein
VGSDLKIYKKGNEKALERLWGENGCKAGDTTSVWSTTQQLI